MVTVLVCAIAFLRFASFSLNLNLEFQGFSCVLQIFRLAFSHSYTKQINCKKRWISLCLVYLSFCVSLSLFFSPTLPPFSSKDTPHKWMSWTKGPPSRSKVDLLNHLSIWDYPGRGNHHRFSSEYILLHMFLMVDLNKKSVCGSDIQDLIELTNR